MQGKYQLQTDRNCNTQCCDSGVVRHAYIFTLIVAALLLQMPGFAFAQSAGNDNSMISIEAESFSARSAAGGHDWKSVSVSGATGNGALQAMPNAGINRDVGYVSNSPQLDYTVNFAEAGTYYVWIRGRGASGSDDSLHVGLNGVARPSAERISDFSSSWGWSNRVRDGSRATLKVSSAGPQTINIWMREDGMVVDKIVLSKYGSMKPGDYGNAGPPITTPGQPASQPASGGNTNSDNVVSVEMEEYTSNVGVGGHDWVPALVSGASGGGSLQALPNNSTNRDTGYVVNSPRLDFNVNFPKSGRYYVWVRGRSQSQGDDSLHVGLNGQAQARADRITGFDASWTWSDKTRDSERASIDVGSAGAQQLTVWMREDGMIVDKIVLSTNASLHPTDFGQLGPPATSPGPTTPTTPTTPTSTAKHIAIEAEQYVSNVGVGGHDWSKVSPSGSSAGGALQALPNVNENNNTGFITKSPRLDYNVQFSKAGTYYVWIRGRGATGSDDSLHVGLNGQAQARADRITGLVSGWSWTNETMDSAPATITVANAGNQTLNIWMREDGVVIDKIMLTTDASAEPEDFGPLGPPVTQTATSGGSSKPTGSTGNTPPKISGTPPTSILKGSAYSFQPTLSDADGDSLTASVSGLPSWATFNSSTGKISGTPESGDVGRYDNIIVTVSDGRDSASLGPFSIDVNAVGTGSVTLAWTPPTQNTDGTALTDLAGYQLRWGPKSGSLDQSVTLSNAGLSSYVVAGIAPGEYSFVMFAVNSRGVSSDPSNSIEVSVQ